MFAKRLFYVSASLLMLAAAYHLGASTASAQLGVGNPIVGGFTNGSGGIFAITPNGDVYGSGNNGATWNRNGNVFGSATGAATQSFGALKARYR